MKQILSDSWVDQINQVVSHQIAWQHLRVLNAYGSTKRCGHMDPTCALHLDNRARKSVVECRQLRQCSLPLEKTFHQSCLALILALKIKIGLVYSNCILSGNSSSSLIVPQEQFMSGAAAYSYFQVECFLIIFTAKHKFFKP